MRVPILLPKPPYCKNRLPPHERESDRIFFDRSSLHFYYFNQGKYLPIHKTQPAIRAGFVFVTHHQHHLFMQQPSANSNRSSRIFLLIGVSILLITCGWCGYQVHVLSKQQEKIKEDYSIVNNISFGLLSISKWRDKIVVTVQSQIENFALTPEQKAELEIEIDGVLRAVIDKAVGIINKPKKTLKGKIGRAVFNTFVDKDDLYKQIPGFSHTIVQKLTNPSSKDRLKSLANTKLQELGKQTYDSSEHAETYLTDSLFKKYKVANDAAFEKTTTKELADIRQQTYIYALSMLGCAVVILLLWLLLRNQPHLHKTMFVLSVIAAVILLIVGLATTMIELDARIKTLDVKLAGTDISFNNQVLFFQSKSILDVVKIMWDTGKWDMIIVGSLIFCFSVLFPFAKLSSALLYLLGKREWMKGKVVHYFAFKSGKWSMADVMVVAIMMTYIGFNGVLQSQLSSLDIHNQYVSSVTTNNTSLQPGYIVFVSYVVFSLILSQILKSMTGEKSE